MKSDRRRGGGLWHAIVDDPYRKLFALALAVLLWVFIDSRITREITRRVQLTVIPMSEEGGEGYDRLAVVLPLNKVVGKGFHAGEQEIDRVDVVLRGPRYRINALEEEPLNLIVSIFAARDWATSAAVEFTAEDVREQKALQGVRIELVPQRIRLEVERIESVPIALSTDLVNLDYGPFGERVLRDTATYSLQTVELRGSAIDMEEIERRSKENRKLFRATLTGNGSEKTVRAPLEIIGSRGLNVQFEVQPFVTVQVLPRTDTFQLDIPIFVDDVSLPPALRGAYAAAEPSRKVRIRAGGVLRTTLATEQAKGQAAVDAWARENLRLIVHLSRDRPPQGQQESREAQLRIIGHPLWMQVERDECRLEDLVVVELSRQP